MGKTGKKDFDEKLQEVRSKHDKVQYLKRKQDEDDGKKRLNDYLKSELWKNRENEDR